jgi:hypothetical protein
MVGLGVYCVGDGNTPLNLAKSPVRSGGTYGGTWSYFLVLLGARTCKRPGLSSSMGSRYFTGCLRYFTTWCVPMRAWREGA